MIVDGKVLKEANGYGIVQRDFMTMDISIYAKCVYTLLRTYSGEKSYCYPSLKTICDDLKISKSTVLRAIKELEEIEMIAVRRGKKNGTNVNSVNTYVPLSVMVEIDIDKMDQTQKEGGFGGVSQIPRGVSHVPRVVSVVDTKNNIYKNNIEEDLNIITEKDFGDKKEKDLFSDTGGSFKKKKEPEKKELTLYQKAVEFWLKEFHVGWNFNATDGVKIKSILAKLKRTLDMSNNETSDINILNLFKKFCVSLPEFYRNENLSVLDSKYDSILEKIKEQNVEKRANSIATRAGATNFKFDVPDVRSNR